MIRAAASGLMAGLGALLLAAPGPVCALEVPAAARLLSERSSPLDSYDLPLAGFDGSRVPSAHLEGAVMRRTWRLDGTSATPLQLLAPLRAELEAEGYRILLDCTAESCGGFDFRYGTEVALAPQMHVDLGNFRFLSARRGAAEAVSLMVSHTGSSAYLQMIEVTPADPGATEIAPAPETELPPTPADAEEALAAVLLAEGHVVLSDLDFGTGADTLGPERYDSLVALAGFLAANPGFRLVFVGHTDSVGGLEANMALSKQRAEAVRARMVADYGADAGRLSADGVGYLAPIAPNTTDAGRERNRRVEAVLLPAG
ncbi:OmpA family protein [Pseudodonghicola flavimaris]|uniref:OmpA family protein n=1 Tax=Pseudodonghicola flavimaris TaxID=3050036 RepID=A0ABT7EWG4_9RHOB|nr:OmpA family protein [Pseudodonghicola flavimaris]MDK3016634.1 OmpA family protein [Pseudodonghicola flavimaris]